MNTQNTNFCVITQFFFVVGKAKYFFVFGKAKIRVTHLEVSIACRQLLRCGRKKTCKENSTFELFHELSILIS